MIHLYNRVRTLLRRRQAAKRLGLRFTRQKDFQLPSVVKVPDGAPIFLPADQHSVVDDFVNVILDDEYGTQLVDTAPSTVLDIGANIGLFSWLALRAWPEARVFSFEPNQLAFDYATKNAERASLMNCAVGKEAGRVTLGGQDQWRMGTVKQSESGTVEMLSLAECIERAGGAVDFAKIDIEGFEWELFKDRDSFEKISRLRMEFHLIGNRTQVMFEKTVRDLGYTIERISNMGMFGVAWLKRS